MKRFDFAAAAAAMLIFPVVLCSCSTGNEAEKKAETTAPRQEAKAEAPAAEAKAEAPAAEVKAEPVLDNSKPEENPAPAAVEKKAEPAPAPKKAKAETGLNPPVEHVVRTGDNLWKIARKYYGSGAKWKLIYEANKSAVKKQDFLEPGTVLVIPADK